MQMGTCIRRSPAACRGCAASHRELLESELLPFSRVAEKAARHVEKLCSVTRLEPSLRGVRLSEACNTLPWVLSTVECRLRLAFLAAETDPAHSHCARRSQHPPKLRKCMQRVREVLRAAVTEDLRAQRRWSRCSGRARVLAALVSRSRVQG